MDPQQPPKRRRPRPPRQKGETETIAIRRLRALELRKAGATFRQIAQALGVDVHTAHGDVTAELLELRSQTAEQAQDLRDLELLRTCCNKPVARGGGHGTPCRATAVQSLQF